MEEGFRGEWGWWVGTEGVWAGWAGPNATTPEPVNCNCRKMAVSLEPTEDSLLWW